MRSHHLQPGSMSSKEDNSECTFGLYEQLFQYRSHQISAGPSVVWSGMSLFKGEEISCR